MMASRRPYSAETLAACEPALRTLMAKVGRWGPHLIVIGGLAPQYLVTRVPDDMPHAGTTDVDIVLGVLTPSDDEPLYATLERKLIEAGFQSTKDSFRWRRDIDGIAVVLEFFCPAGDGQPGRIKRRPQAGTGSRVSALMLPGAELAGRDYIVRRLSGLTLDRGGTRTVDVRVVNLLPFLVLKALALHHRDKDKDAYDIVWTLNAFDSGPTSAAVTAMSSPVVGEPLVHTAIALLHEHFDLVDAAGCCLYARFHVGEGGNDENRLRMQRYANATVRDFLATWDARRSDLR